MIVIRQHRIYRKDIQANRDVLYIFGDNLMRQGFGGQAAEMRGEPNSFGIATKRTPAHNYPEDYFHDEEDDVHSIIHAEFDDLHLYIRNRNYKAIIIPMDGIGTGLSKLPEHAPKLLEIININLKNLEKL